MKKKQYNPPKTAHDAVFANIEELIPIIEECLAYGRSVERTPMGRSMQPFIRGGRDSVILSSAGKIRKYDAILYRRESGAYVLHRVIGIDENRYIAVGDRQYTCEWVDRENVIAVVSAVRRDGRLIDVGSFAYRTMVRVWHFTRPLRKILAGIKRKIKG